MKTIFERFLEWLIGQNPGMGAMIMFVTCAIWCTTVIKDFQHRMDSFDQRMDSFDQRMDSFDRRLQKTEEDINEIKGDITQIKLFMKKIDTYLSTKDKDYPE